MTNAQFEQIRRYTDGKAQFGLQATLVVDNSMADGEIELGAEDRSYIKLNLKESVDLKHKTDRGTRLEIGGPGWPE